MSSIAKSAAPSGPQRQPRRIWRAPLTRAWWLWLAASAVLYGVILLGYFYAIRTQPDAGPSADPLRLFGIIAFVLVLVTASYTLRRRFARGLPGMVRGWLWMHIWLGSAALLIALLHENFDHILNDYCQNLNCFTDSYGGTSALFALFVLVVSGVAGRLLDIWQARVIARDAEANGVGIARSIEERMLELEYGIERLCAGKSEAFKEYFMLALDGTSFSREALRLPVEERGDFQRGNELIQEYTGLVQSLKRQGRARAIIRVWRYIHIPLAIAAVLIILFHGIMEFVTSVL